MNAWPASPPLGHAGSAGSPDTAAPAVRPKAWWYLLALPVLVVGIVAGVLVIRRTIDDVRRTANREVTRYPVNQAGTVTFDSLGEFTLYFEGPASLVDASDVHALVDKLDIRFEDAVTGEAVPLRHNNGFDVSGQGARQRVAIHTFTIDRTGDYVLEVRTSAFPSELTFVSVGRDPFESLLIGVAVGSWILLATVVAAVFALVGVGVTRGRSKRLLAARGILPGWPGRPA